MNANWEQYQAAYQAADQKTKDILHSSLIPECVAESIKKYKLDESNQKVLVELFSEKTLSLLSEPRLVEEMRKAGIPSASIVSTEINQCIQTKKPAVPDTSLVTERKIASDKVTGGATNSPQPDSLETDIAETEAALNAIPHIRTMVTDAKESKTHTTSQSDLLDKENRWTPKK
jgi:hypothetical protein